MNTILTSGSSWCRWDPHIHAPGTVLNDQFGAQDPWATYLKRLENSTPVIRAIGVTDYYLLDTYKKIIEYKDQGRLPNIDLIFPNVELRLDIAAKSGFVNIHLLVNPDAENHIVELERVLSRFEFEAYGDTFNCHKDDLIRLGKMAGKPDDTSALEEGATQYKVSFNKLRDLYKKSDWMQNNVLVAVAGGKGDGTSGLQQASDAVIRQEIEKFAHIIFASSVAQREFWTGYRGVPKEQLVDRYDGCKPCLHGSDTHHPDTIGNPEYDRYCWVKGAPAFDTLKQACIDPEYRAFVGQEPPFGALPSKTISQISIENADWAKTNTVPLNAGLVAVIGARGSGKTALADMIATACDAVPLNIWEEENAQTPSFIGRAKSLLTGVSAKLTWANNDVDQRALDGSQSSASAAYPKARYLSQQFVEDLCSSAGMSDGLVKEIERVVFQAHSQQTTDDALNFTQLRTNKTFLYQQARNQEEQAITDLSGRIAEEIENESKVAQMSVDTVQRKDDIKKLTEDRGMLKLTATPEQVARHSSLAQAVEKKKTQINAFRKQRRMFEALQVNVASTRSNTAPELLRKAKDEFLESGLNDDQWSAFLLIFSGTVDDDLSGYIRWADQEIAKLQGAEIVNKDKSQTLIAANVDLDTLTFHLLNAELDRLSGFISTDQKIRQSYKVLTDKIAQETAALEIIEKRLTQARGAADRRKTLQGDRLDCYGRIFNAIVSEQKSLEDLYQPLLTKLAATDGTLSKLRFSVSRIVDVEKWGEFGEKNLFDRRKDGATKGVGSLTQLVRNTLVPAWQTGSETEVQAAMTAFMEVHLLYLLSHAPYSKAEQTDFRNWLNRFARWLFATDHITIRYEINYDGVDIRKLSPGTRGIVLLLLYLALDDQDDSPLIIDQPEENLDPKSVNDELVPLFIAAKTRRQVIIVTHNANLVVNTDADQIIIAEAGPHPAGGLPPITYKGGGLEKRSIREEVCKILEGGEPAFRERARRLRVNLER